MIYDTYGLIYIPYNMLLWLFTLTLDIIWTQPPWNQSFSFFSPWYKELKPIRLFKKFPSFNFWSNSYKLIKFFEYTLTVFEAKSAQIVNQDIHPTRGVCMPIASYRLTSYEHRWDYPLDCSRITSLHLYLPADFDLSRVVGISIVSPNEVNFYPPILHSTYYMDHKIWLYDMALIWWLHLLVILTHAVPFLQSVPMFHHYSPFVYIANNYFR